MFKSKLNRRLIASIIVIIGYFFLKLSYGDAFRIIYFIDWFSLLYVTLIPIAILLFSGLLKDYLISYKAALTKHCLSLKQLKLSEIACKLSFITVLLTGLMGSIISVVITLRMLDNPSNLGVSLSVTLLIALYSSLINLVQITIWAILKRQIIELEESAEATND